MGYRPVCLFLFVPEQANERHGGGGVFGSSEVNVENWKPLTRLVGHTAGELYP